MKKYFYTLIVVIAYSFVFQACAPLEVNPGFRQKGPFNGKPVWKIGYKWVYEWEKPDSSGTLTRRIVREDTFDGIPCFVMEVGAGETFITKDVLGYLGYKRGGKVRIKRDAPLQPLAWPLKVGKKWKNVFTGERPQEGFTWDLDTEVTVIRLEEVTVPAGKFKAFRIEIYRGGNLRFEYWYSPKVKWFVKKISYIGRGSRPREERLKSYRVD